MAKVLDIQLGEDNAVHFLQASKQVLRFCCVNSSLDELQELAECEEKMDKKEVEKLKKLVNKRSKMLDEHQAEVGGSSITATTQIAATKLQMTFKGLMERRRARKKPAPP